jgi:hypothetical protein
MMRRLKLDFDALFVIARSPSLSAVASFGLSVSGSG